jgi:hypothetical protein
MERRKSRGQDDFWCCSLAADVRALFLTFLNVS